MKWEKLIDLESKVEDFNGVCENLADGYEVKLPSAYYANFWTNEMTALLVDQSNLYATQCGKVLNTNTVEMQKFLGILIKIGITKFPRLRMYWQEGFRLETISSHMTRNRFETILRYLHFSDNNEIVINQNNSRYDRLAKIKPLLDLFRAQCLLTMPQQRQNIDEQIIPFKGKHNCFVNT